MYAVLTLAQVYSHHPCEKALSGRGLCYIGLRIYSDEAQEQLWLDALPNITNGFCRAQTHDFVLTRQTL